MHLEKAEKKVMKKASLLTSYFWDRAYSNGSDSTAIEITEEAFKPILSYDHGDGDRPDFMEINDYLDGYWQEVEEEINDSRDELVFGIDYEWHPLSDHYERLKESFEPGSFDNIIGIYLSGIPLSILASDYFEGDHLIMRYSHHRRNDKEIMITEGIEDDMEIEDSRNLLIDDVLQTGRTIKQISSYLFDRGSSEIIACPMMYTRDSDLNCQNFEVFQDEEGLEISLMEEIQETDQDYTSQEKIKE